MKYYLAQKYQPSKYIGKSNIDCILSLLTNRHEKNNYRGLSGGQEEYSQKSYQ